MREEKGVEMTDEPQEIAKQALSVSASEARRETKKKEG
jgi:hypothetical protein